jgi:hypothetical protein
MKQVTQLAATALLAALSFTACAEDAQLKYITVGQQPNVVTFQIENMEVVEVNGDIPGVTAVSDQSQGAVTVISQDCNTVIKVTGSSLVLQDTGECSLPIAIENTAVNTATSTERSVSINSRNGVNFIKLS